MRITLWSCREAEEKVKYTAVRSFTEDPPLTACSCVGNFCAMSVEEPKTMSVDRYANFQGVQMYCMYRSDPKVG